MTDPSIVARNRGDKGRRGELTNSHVGADPRHSDHSGNSGDSRPVRPETGAEDQAGRIASLRADLRRAEADGDQKRAAKYAACLARLGVDVRELAPGGATPPAERCPGCGGETFEVRCERGPHFARRGCRACGKHLGWVAAPMTRERAADWTLPVGKYRGRTIAQVAATDRAYLEWVAEAFEPGSIRRAARAFLGRAES